MGDLLTAAIHGGAVGFPPPLTHIAVSSGAHGAPLDKAMCVRGGGKTSAPPWMAAVGGKRSPSPMRSKGAGASSSGGTGKGKGWGGGGGWDGGRGKGSGGSGGKPVWTAPTSGPLALPIQGSKGSMPAQAAQGLVPAIADLASGAAGPPAQEGQGLSGAANADAAAAHIIGLVAGARAAPAVAKTVEAAAATVALAEATTGADQTANH